MKPTSFFTFAGLTIGGILWLAGCTTVIDARLDEGPVQLSVDGTLTDQPGPQTIRLTQTAAYFDSSTPPVASGATVTVTDGSGRRYIFSDPDSDGYYVWSGGKTDTLGHVGQTYTLNIGYQGDTYQATTRMNRVPDVDSVVFRRQKINPISSVEGFQAEFYARDFPGATDYYRIRYYRNGRLQNKPRDIITVQDASFPGSADTDGLVFIRPIRQSANPDSLYAMNDALQIEIQSLTAEGFAFWQQLRSQITNGGLFATPPANLPTNVINLNPNGRSATGFFSASATRSRLTKVSTAMLRP